MSDLQPAGGKAPQDPSDDGGIARMLVAIVAQSRDLVALASSGGEIVYMNDAGRRMLGVAPLPASLVLAVPDLFESEDGDYAREVILADFERSGHWSGDFRIKTAGGAGKPIPVRLSMFAVQDLEAGIASAAIGIVCRDISARRVLETRLRFLVDAGAALAISLDYGANFKNLARLIVNSFASLCVLDVFSRDEGGRGSIERVAAAHVDPGRDARLDVLMDFVPDTRNAVHPIVEAIASGSSSLVSMVDDAWIERIAISSEHAAALHALELRSLITVPLVGGGDMVGALTCALTTGDERSQVKRAYDAEDLFFIEEVGRRAGAALLNARLYARERRIAVSLQDASLPQTLPQFEGVRIDADYRPGSDEATIGGDWFDAFVLDDGRIALTVGDVAGHGLQAAITMTKLRQAMQSAALVEPDPNTMLRVANRTLCTQHPDTHATALAAILDVRAGTLTFGCAGHPGPLVRGAAGSVEEFLSVGIPLGVRYDVRYRSRTIELSTPSLFVLFTDGLVEATRNILAGYERLRTALSLDALMESPLAARALVDAMLPQGNARDDVAVLAVRLGVTLPADPAG